MPILQTNPNTSKQSEQEDEKKNSNAKGPGSHTASDEYTQQMSQFEAAGGEASSAKKTFEAFA